MLLYYLLYALAAAYFAWRLLVNLRRREDIRRQVSALTFLAAFALLWVIFLLFPGISQPAAAMLLAVFFAAAVVVNLYLFRRYDRWLEEQDAEQ
ncbi:MAG: hypothetical protein HFF78_05345 [Oscillospiraceae bacterium]|nr:hypothetical protein [Oscillospiraceae bacterium]